MKKAPTFGKFEKRVARRIAAYLRKSKTRSPKKWEVIQHDHKNDPNTEYTIKRGYVSHAGQTDRRAFANLVKLGLVTHARNGHCCLTRECYLKLGLALERVRG